MVKEEVDLMSRFVKVKSLALSRVDDVVGYHLKGIIFLNTDYVISVSESSSMVGGRVFDVELPDKGVEDRFVHVTAQCAADILGVRV